MSTRTLLISIVLLFLAACAPGRQGGSATPLPAPAPQGMDVLQRDEVIYRVRERMVVVNRGGGQPEKHNVWIALIGDVEPYQQVLEMEVTPETYDLTIDEHGNRYAEFNLAGIAPSESREIELKYRVRVKAIRPLLVACEGEAPDIYNRAELHVESNNPQIRAIAEGEAAGKATDCDVIRAYYDFVAQSLRYTYNHNDWGAQAALGDMGADCTEYSSLLMALARAHGLPSRYLAGLYYAPAYDQALGRVEHSWLEVYLPGNGWLPMDPTLGRSSLTRATYFASLPPNHIIVTRGRNPSTLRGSSFWTHLYWPGDSAEIRIEDFGWDVVPEIGDQ